MSHVLNFTAELASVKHAKTLVVRDYSRMTMLYNLTDTMEQFTDDAHSLECKIKIS